MTRPTLTFIAGANGSGKTTLTRWNSELFEEIPLLDPDAIANTLQATASTLFPMAAGRHVLKSAKEHLKKTESFAVETTLAGKHYLQMMLDARNRGFEIVLVYIGTENVEINLARIRNRVLAGGHDVPEEDVRRLSGRLTGGVGPARRGGAMAIGALALGAVAVGALAIGTLAIGRLAAS